MSPEAQEWTKRLEARLPEIRTASSQALAQGRPDLAAQLIVPLSRYWRMGPTRPATPSSTPSSRPARGPPARPARTFCMPSAPWPPTPAASRRPLHYWRPLSANSANSGTSTASSRVLPTSPSTSTSKATQPRRWCCSARASAWRGPWPAFSSWSPLYHDAALAALRARRRSRPGLLAAPAPAAGSRSRTDRRPPSPRKAQP
jgi:hypothetical protein